MNRKVISLLLGAILIMTLLVGCGNESEVSETETQEKNSAINFVDDEGNEINLDAPAQKIISFYSAHTENLYALGAGDKIIGGSKTCVYPAEAASMANYDYHGDPEQVIAAGPDLVIIRPHITRTSPDFVESIKNAGIQVVSLYPESYEDFPDYINKLAKLAGKEDKATELLEDFNNNLDKITELTSNIEDKQTVFFESTETNVRTVAEGTMPDIAIKRAGGINIAEGAEPTTEGSSIAEYGTEKVISNGDKIDVYVSQRGTMNAGGNLRSISQRPGFDTISAVKNGRVYVINEKLISSPTFRFYKGVRELARYMYPDVLDDLSSYENDSKATREDFSYIIVKSLHLPIYVPSSSKYYQSEHDTHTYGMFSDTNWQDDNFDYIETAIYGGYIEWQEGDDGEEYFNPQDTVTREELAKTVFLIGEFGGKDDHTSISDLESCKNAKIVQKLVDNNIFDLDENGNFNPDSEVTYNEIVSTLKLVKDNMSK